MWRVVLGYSGALLNHVGEDGVWRPPGGGNTAALVTSAIESFAPMAMSRAPRMS